MNPLFAQRPGLLSIFVSRMPRQNACKARPQPRLRHSAGARVHKTAERSWRIILVRAMGIMAGGVVVVTFIAPGRSLEARP